MPIRLQNFQMPEKVEKDAASASPTFGRYSAGPFEIGYARTLGNSLRRVLLSSIKGTAISQIKIEGLPQECATIEGVTEDGTQLVINLKGVRLGTNTSLEEAVVVEKAGPCEVTAADIAKASSALTVYNPDHHIATVAKGARFHLELKVETGRGFVPATWGEKKDIGWIALDRIFSPVTLVNFEVSNTRVGQQTDYEKLTLEITTDGRVSPDQAMVQSAQILKDHLDVFTAFDKSLCEPEQKGSASAGSAEDEQKKAALRELLNRHVDDLELSVRATNAVHNQNIEFLGDLCTKKDADLLKLKNFGKTSLDDIKKCLAKFDLSTGMTFPEDVWPNA